MPEYKATWYKPPTHRNDIETYRFKWLRVYTLPEARNKAKWLIAHGLVDKPNPQLKLPEHIRYVEIGKGTKDGEKTIGVVVKYGERYYWVSPSGLYHLIRKDGSIEPKDTYLLGMPSKRKLRVI